MSDKNISIIVGSETYTAGRHIFSKSFTLRNLIEEVGSDGIVLDIPGELWKIVFAYLMKDGEMPRRKHPRYPEDWELRLLDHPMPTLLKLIDIADYLDIANLIDAVATIVGTYIRSLPLPDIRKLLEITDDLTELEHATINAENANVIIY